MFNIWNISDSTQTSLLSTSYVFLYVTNNNWNHVSVRLISSLVARIFCICWDLGTLFRDNPLPYKPQTLAAPHIYHLMYSTKICKTIEPFMLPRQYYKHIIS